MYCVVTSPKKWRLNIQPSEKKKIFWLSSSSSLPHANHQLVGIFYFFQRHNCSSKDLNIFTLGWWLAELLTIEGQLLCLSVELNFFHRDRCYCVSNADWRRDSVVFFFIKEEEGKGVVRTTIRVLSTWKKTPCYQQQHTCQIFLKGTSQKTSSVSH